MLANVQAAQQQINATAAINHQPPTLPPNLHLAATMNASVVMNNNVGNKPEDFMNKNVKQSIQSGGVVPMDLENENLIDNRQSMNGRGGDSGVDLDGKGSVGLRFNNEMMFSNMLGLPGNQVLHQGQFPMVMPGMMDPALLNLQQLQMVQQINRMNQIPAKAEASSSNEVISQGSSNGQGKELIQCKSCTLIPPNPNAPKPTTREKPPGCRTVFVGGLPDNITEQIIHEIFERCGRFCQYIDFREKY